MQISEELTARVTVALGFDRLLQRVLQVGLKIGTTLFAPCRIAGLARLETAMDRWLAVAHWIVDIARSVVAMLSHEILHFG
jgi:hypothetical protein